MRLADGTDLAADLVLVAVGAQPATDWLTGSGLSLTNGVDCDELCRAAPAWWRRAMSRAGSTPASAGGGSASSTG
ncbi:hypothetical protein NKH77_11325 [Streptomyces sp. M19]